MSSSSEDSAPAMAETERYAAALRRVRPRIHCLAFTLPAIILAFVVPAIALCGHTTQAGIVCASVGAMLATAFAFLWASAHLEQRQIDNPRVDDLLASCVLTFAAALLLGSLAAAPVPLRETSFAVWPTAAIIVASAILGAVLLARRARRLATGQIPRL